MNSATTTTAKRALDDDAKMMMMMMMTTPTTTTTHHPECTNVLLEENDMDKDSPSSTKLVAVVPSCCRAARQALSCSSQAAAAAAQEKKPPWNAKDAENDHFCSCGKENDLESLIEESKWDLVIQHCQSSDMMQTFMGKHFYKDRNDNNHDDNNDDNADNDYQDDEDDDDEILMTCPQLIRAVERCAPLHVVAALIDSLQKMIRNKQATAAAAAAAAAAALPLSEPLQGKTTTATTARTLSSKRRRRSRQRRKVKRQGQGRKRRHVLEAACCIPDVDMEVLDLLLEAFPSAARTPCAGTGLEKGAILFPIHLAAVQCESYKVLQALAKAWRQGMETPVSISQGFFLSSSSSSSSSASSSSSSSCAATTPLSTPHPGVFVGVVDRCYKLELHHGMLPLHIFFLRHLRESGCDAKSLLPTPDWYTRRFPLDLACHLMGQLRSRPTELQLCAVLSKAIQEMILSHPRSATIVDYTTGNLPIHSLFLSPPLHFPPTHSAVRCVGGGAGVGVGVGVGPSFRTYGVEFLGREILGVLELLQNHHYNGIRTPSYGRCELALHSACARDDMPRILHFLMEQYPDAIYQKDFAGRVPLQRYLPHLQRVWTAFLSTQAADAASSYYHQRSRGQVLLRELEERLQVAYQMVAIKPEIIYLPSLVLEEDEDYGFGLSGRSFAEEPPASFQQVGDVGEEGGSLLEFVTFIEHNQQSQLSTTTRWSWSQLPTSTLDAAVSGNLFHSVLAAHTAMDRPSCTGQHTRSHRTVPPRRFRKLAPVSSDPSMETLLEVAYPNGVAGWDPNCQNGEPLLESPLHVACRYASSPTIAKVLRTLNRMDRHAIRKMASVQTPFHDNDDLQYLHPYPPPDRLPLHIACEVQPCLEVIKEILAFFGGAIDVRDSSGMLPFTIACLHDASLDVLYTLLRESPAINLPKI